jgi:hypothetical protein
MNEQELLADCLRRLNRSGVTYYLTGSMASNYWGVPRTTHDLDFVIQLPASAVAKIVSAFAPDFYIEEAAVRAALKVDFWLPKPEPFDREMLRRRVHVTLFGEPAWIATAEDVILHKLVWNRISPSDRQLGDAAGVMAVQAGALDKNYLKQWARELKLTGELEKLLSGEIKPKQT